MLGFSSIYYDRFNNKINFWYYDDNRNKKHIVKDYVHFYYEPVKYETDLKDTNGNYVERREVESLELMESIRKSQKNLSESDLTPEVKFLQEVLHGNRFKADSTLINTAYIDIEVAGENEFPYPEVAKYPINLITVKCSKNGQVYTFGTQEYTGERGRYVENYYWNESEEIMLQTFATWFAKQKFDVITGWNSEGFDIPYMYNRYKNLDILNSFKLLSPIKKVYYSERKGTVSIAGLNHLDYMLLFKNFTFENQPSYSLQAIGVLVTGEGKLELDGALNHIYKTDWNTFVDYNIQDVLLVEKIDKKKRFIELAFNFAYQACIPPERVYSSITLIEGYLLGYQHDSGTVMPDRKELAPDWWIEGEYYRVNGTLQNYPEGDDDDKFGPYYVKGGYVMAKPGKKHIGMSFDVTSEYPHMVMQYNISPETKVILPPEHMKKDLIESEINGVYYKKHSEIHGVLPRWIKKMFDERAYFKKLMFVAEGLSKGFDIEKIAELNKLTIEKAQAFINEVHIDFPNKDYLSAYNYYDSQQHIRKILINSAYGAMANEWFHYYDVDNARAVTRGGRVLIRYLAHSANEYMKSQEFCDWANSVFGKAVNVDKIQEDSLRLIDTDSVIGSTIVKTSLGDIAIEKLYDMSINKTEYEGEKFIARLPDVKATAFDLTNNLVNNDINYIMKHKVTKRMFKIKCKGKEITITEDHGLIVIRDGIQTTVKPNEIIKGDKLVKICKM